MSADDRSGRDHASYWRSDGEHPSRILYRRSRSGEIRPYRRSQVIVAQMSKISVENDLQRGADGGASSGELSLIVFHFYLYVLLVQTRGQLEDFLPSFRLMVPATTCPG